MTQVRATRWTARAVRVLLACALAAGLCPHAAWADGPDAEGAAEAPAAAAPSDAEAPAAAGTEPDADAPVEPASPDLAEPADPFAGGGPAAPGADALDEAVLEAPDEIGEAGLAPDAADPDAADSAADDPAAAGDAAGAALERIALGGLARAERAAASGAAAATSGASPAGGSAAATATARCAQGAALVALADGAVDLNAAWAAQEGGLDQTFPITEGGTYRLTADMETPSLLIVRAKGQDVVIDFAGHTLTSSTVDSGQAVSITQAASVTVLGAGGALVFHGDPINAAIQSRADRLVVRDLSISSKAPVTTLAQLGSYGIDVAAGTLEATGCTITVDQSNQSKPAGGSSATVQNAPSGIYLETGCKGAAVVDCTVDVTGSPSVAEQGESVRDVGHASALLSATASAVTVEGGSFSARIMHGSASAVAGRNVTLRGQMALAANARRIAAGVESTAAGGVVLDARLSLDASGESLPQASPLLYSRVQGGFSFASGFDAQEAGVLVGASLDAANGDGDEVGTCRSGVQADRVRAVLRNALGEDAPCSIAPGGPQVRFALDAPAATVEVLHGGSTARFATVAAAMAAAQPGDTVRLLADAVSLTYAGAAGASLSLDLNGHVLAHLEHAGAGSLSVFSGAEGGAVRTADPSVPEAVVLSGTGTLELAGVSVEADLPVENATAIGVTAGGALVLRGADVRATCQGQRARAIAAAGANARVSAVDSTVCAGTANAGVVVQAIYAASPTAVVDVLGGSVTARGVDAECGAICAQGTVRVRGAGAQDPAVIDVRTSAVSDNAYGVSCLGAGRGILVDARVSVACDVDAAAGEYWCLLDGTPAAEGTAQWALDGLVELSGPNGALVRHAVPVLVGGSLEAPAPVLLSSDLLDADVAARPAAAGDLTAAGVQAGTAAGDLSYAANLLRAAPSSAYAGRVLAGADALAWTRAAAVARVTHGGEATDFPTLEAALAAARDGDAVRVLADCALGGSVTVTAGIDLDLAGRTVSWNVGDDAAATVAIAFAGSGSSTLRDSAGTGALDIACGLPLETAARTYAGLAVRGQAVRVDAAVHVRFQGESKLARAITLHGVQVSGGSLTLCPRADVQVQASPAADAYGALSAYGVYLDSSARGDALVVERGAAVRVENLAASLSRGSTTISSSTSTGTADLVQVFPDPESELYRQIVAAFRAQASYDAQTDTAGYEYGSNIYYAAPATLPDGTSVWAFSDVVDPDEAGPLELVVPSRMFIKTRYEEPALACGVAAVPTFSGRVQVEGDVSATARNGDAYGIYADDAGTWTVAGAALSAQAAERDLRVVLGAFDLRDYLDFGGRFDDVAIVYPAGKLGSSSPANTVAGDRAAYELDLFAGSRAKVTRDGAAQGHTELALPALADAGVAVDDASRADVFDRGTVTVTFGNLRDATGALRASQAVRLPYGQTMREAGLSVPAAGDYVQDGVTYRFVGWSVTGDPSPFAWGAEAVREQLALASTYLDASNQGRLAARYVPVAAGQVLATFDVDGRFVALAVAPGERPVFQLAYGAGVVVPAKQDTQSSYSYPFTGWRVGDATYRGTLPAVRADAVFQAGFDAVPTQLTLNLNYWKEGAQATAYISHRFAAPVDSDPNGYAAQVARLGDTLLIDHALYTFLGWAPRPSDTEPLYTDDLPPFRDEDTGFASNLTYFGIYAKGDHRVNVRFVSEGQVVSQAEGVLGAATIAEALAASSNPTPPADLADGGKFLGWAAAPDATSALSSALVVLSSLTGASDELTLYAVYGSRAAVSVTFVGADRTTALSVVQMPWGSVIAEGMEAAGASLPDAYAGGRYLAAWTTYAGDPVDLATQTVTSNLRLYPSYGDLSSDVSAPGVQADVGSAYVDDGAGGPVDAGAFTLRSVSDLDPALQRAVQNAGYFVIKRYDVGVTRMRGDVAAPVTGNFGIVKLTFDVGVAYANSNVRVCWLKSDGTFGSSAAKELVGGACTFNLNDWFASDEGGNLVVVGRAGGADAGDGGLAGGGSAGGLAGGSAGGGTGGGSGGLSGGGLSGGLSGGLAAGSGGGLTVVTVKEEGSDEVAPAAAAALVRTRAEAAGSADEDDVAASTGTVRGAFDSAAPESALDRAADALQDTFAEEQRANAALFVALALALAAGAAWLVRWFALRRRDFDDDEPDLPASAAVESISF